MLDEIYNRRVLELAADIPRLGRLPAPDATAKAHSRLCGSTVVVDLVVKDGRVVDFAHDVQGLRARPGLVVADGAARDRRDGRGASRAARGDDPNAEAERPAAGGQMGGFRGARAGARLQGAPCLDAADVRRGRRRARPDPRGERAPETRRCE